MGRIADELRGAVETTRRDIDPAVLPQRPTPEERRASMVMTIVFFIIGLSVIMSYKWTDPTPGFTDQAPQIILFGILVAAIIYIASRYAGRMSPLLFRLCVACGRQIPADANWCPYCGREIR